jgi:hypothetical protein
MMLRQGEGATAGGRLSGESAERGAVARWARAESVMAAVSR